MLHLRLTTIKIGEDESNAGYKDIVITKQELLDLAVDKLNKETDEMHILQDVKILKNGTEIYISKHKGN